MRLEQNELFEGERVVIERKANAIINFKDFGMEKIKHSPFRKKEAIGGKLYVTNYRFIFKSHSLNRVRGMYSILLPTIQSVRDISFLLVKKIEVISNGNTYVFVVWGIKELLEEVERVKSNLSMEEKKWLENIRNSNDEKCGEGLKKFKGMEEIMKHF
ncbi:hypothetical protein QUF88_07435 [Bacillus sp. DX1.1]|uniref:hypothetical protein n=1 Tax=unclassified Bacillus (in: firmicutes) TaxID=185979 RepID=UPI00256FB47B|nr:MULTISPECIES: hypothetical protein [unclassified Bacillus (in: firmicutes)]MDM5153664.1 hypothetical protein [Bacillus sp. DX1.1]WJE82605.1 hypothetical protein QRE67_04940 [Bacillus sp. DX3.1]